MNGRPERGAQRRRTYPLLMRAARHQGILGAMGNPFGITLDDDRLRWAAAEGVPESVIAAIFCLLHDERSVDEIVARLTTAELEQVINIAGRSPQVYPPGAYAALKEHRHTRLTKPPAACRRRGFRRFRTCRSSSAKKARSALSSCLIEFRRSQAICRARQPSVAFISSRSRPQAPLARRRAAPVAAP
jgi:hypothetical protein